MEGFVHNLWIIESSSVGRNKSLARVFQFVFHCEVWTNRADEHGRDK